jgi:hypothetical protein
MPTTVNSSAPRADAGVRADRQAWAAVCFCTTGLAATMLMALTYAPLGQLSTLILQYNLA